MFRRLIISLSVTVFLSCGGKEDDVVPVIINNIVEAPETTTYQVNISTSEGGTVNVSSGNYSEGTVLNITASPSSGYVFSGWEGFDSSNPSITINVNQAYNLEAQFINQEELVLDQDIVTENTSIENAQKLQGTPTPNSSIPFTIENSDYLMAIIENGFNLDLSVPENVEGAYIQFKNDDGEPADSYFSVSRSSISSKSKIDDKLSFNKINPWNQKNKTVKKQNSVFSIEINFSQNITAGIICLNVFLYESNNVSEPIEVCVTVNNFGAGPTNIIGAWEFSGIGYENYEIFDWYIREGDPSVDEVLAYVSENQIYEIDGCYESNCLSYYCNSNTQGLSYTSENINSQPNLGYLAFKNIIRKDFVEFYADGSYKISYQDIIIETPTVFGSIESCLEDENIGAWVNYTQNFYPTIRSLVQYGKWAYDNDSNTVGAVIDSYEIIDSNGQLLYMSPIDFDNPRRRFRSVEINGDSMTLKENVSGSSDLLVYYFDRITDTNNEPEIFSGWYPDFVDQTTNFTQIRLGTQGTQQTRTIIVNSSSSTSSSTEELIDIDINGDGDLFEDIEISTTIYIASENLGSFEMSTYNLISDNNMGMTIGNNFYPFSDGFLFDYGRYDEYDYQDCEALYNLDLYIYSEGIQYGNDPSNSWDDNELYGSGDFIYFELWMPQQSLNVGNYTDQLVKYNERYNQSFLDGLSFDNWYCNNYDCDSVEDDFYQIPCSELFFTSSYNGYSVNISTAGGDYIEGGDNQFNFTEGTLSVSKDSNNIYTIKLTNGENYNRLPVTLFYKGYIGYHNMNEPYFGKRNYKLNKIKRGK